MNNFYFQFGTSARYRAVVWTVRMSRSAFNLQRHFESLCANARLENGRQGRTRTYVVSNVRDLQSRAFATQLHLTIKNKKIASTLKITWRLGIEPKPYHSSYQAWNILDCRFELQLSYVDIPTSQVPFLHVENVLVCVYNLKVISQQAMLPNQFRIQLVVITLICKRCMVLYRSILLCLN